ncbi:hypothetical protein MCUN1_003762 [Malassezia cuniculi]|uniref:Uncharacterized protein n=1 Tax=Malassezia cuniculi TaxID=948313 RepID=A0AAF0JDF3_9BASI|nr:hypothetical protein MCUN1_003762 [Malassezia cuniculi]
MSDTESARQHLVLTEIFGVNPHVIVDALVVAANEHLYILGTKLEETIRADVASSPEADRRAEQGVHAILTLLENAIDHTLDTFELYCLRSIFVISDEQTKHITMEHHRGLDLRAKEEDTEGTTPPAAAEDSLRRQIMAARTVQHLLAQAERAAKARLARMRAVKTAFAFIVDGANEHLGGGDLEGITSTALAAGSATRANAHVLIDAVGPLISAKPLTQALCAPQELVDDVERPQWDKGRDEYLNWEANRIIASMKRSH